MKIEGLEHIQKSPLLQLLFDLGKDWMLEVSKTNGVEEEDRTISVGPKSIGRNPGFIINILSANKKLITTFYAKVQGVSMDTVLIHHVLKEMKCGPDLFQIPLLQSPNKYHHGVITEKVQHWSMVSKMTSRKKNDLIKDSDRFFSATFLLTILIELGRFGGIPSNGDNWGFINASKHSAPFPGLSIVDFSKGNTSEKRFESKQGFRNGWRTCLNYLITSWQIVQDGTHTLHNNPLDKETIELHADRFPFLQSARAFSDLLQVVCDQTARWLQAHVLTTVHTFRYTSRPNTNGLPVIYETMVVEYVVMVMEWNTSLSALYKWFPFQFDDNGNVCREKRFSVRSQSSVTEQKATFVTSTANPAPVGPGVALKGALVPSTSAILQRQAKDAAIQVSGKTPAESVKASGKVSRVKNQNLGMRVSEGGADKRTQIPTETTCCAASCTIMCLY